MNEIVNELEHLVAEILSMKFSIPQYGTIEEIKMWVEGCEECQSVLLRIIRSRIDAISAINVNNDINNKKDENL